MEKNVEYDTSCNSTKNISELYDAHGKSISNMIEKKQQTVE